MITEANAAAICTMVQLKFWPKPLVARLAGSMLSTLYTSDDASASPGRSIPVLKPMLNRSWYFLKTVFPSINAMCIMASLQDTMMVSSSARSPCPPFE